MIALYNTLIYQPLLNALIALYQTIAFKDFGVAIILLTILVRILLYPLLKKSIQHQAAMQALQPKLREVQERHKNNKEKQVQETFALYREHKTNPFMGLVPVIVQLPLLIALYQLFLGTFDSEISALLYEFVPPPASLNTTFLGLINLKESNMLIAGIAALAQYFQSKQALALAQQNKVAGQDQAARMAQTLVFIGPILTLVIFAKLPAALSLYMTTTLAVSFIQHHIVTRTIHHGKVGNIHR